MGIKNLNKYIISTCGDSGVKKIHIKELAGTKVAVDASIYMYRFLGENKLVEHTYLMTSIFRAYNIIPVFIFDGVPPAEKAATIQERKEQKHAAQEAYYTIKKQLVDGLDGDEKYELEIEMERLKKQFIRIKDTDIEIVKSILDKSGIDWLDAPGEADELCAYLARTKKVDACMSEDMDMFAYGCPCILRNFSLIKQSIVSYDLSKILACLKMNMIEFRSILALAGNDYNKDENTNLYEVMKWFCDYKQAIILMDRVVPSFYDWIAENGFGIKDRAALDHVYEMFELNDDLEKAYQKYVVCRSGVNMDDLRKILEPEGFIFAAYM